MVERYHTWPTHRTQTVAEHTWQVLRIWDRLFGPPDERDFRYIMYHDSGELWTGDLPFPVKRRYPALAGIVDDIEDQALQAMRVDYREPNPGWKTKMKLCDMIEMWETGRHEVALGNSYARPIVSDCEMYISEAAMTLGVEALVRELMDEFI